MSRIDLVVWRLSPRPITSSFNSSLSSLSYYTTTPTR